MIKDTSEKPHGTRRSGYLGHLLTAASHELRVQLRQRRIIVAAGVTFVPVLIPLALAFLSVGYYGNNGQEVFAYIIEYLYLKAMAPLLALFFGSMLIGDAVEAQTITYVLTRPMPRSAWILGKFTAYLVVAGAILVTSIALTFHASMALGGLEADHDTLKWAAEYVSVSLFALVIYGTICSFLGARVRRPVVLGVALVFGWQRFAGLVPGMVDFLTLEKYVMALLPPAIISREPKVLEWFGIEFPKQQYIITNTRATATLLLLSIAFLFWTAYSVRKREYSSADAVGS
ncbi:MAG TPA: hypothetical protein ENN80_06050 [Candidatus Hydrogenedentes bacterium]|nr:hypothetical protein [Candidatus Hydrogenedentota bacterium]